MLSPSTYSCYMHAGKSCINTCIHVSNDPDTAISTPTHRSTRLQIHCHWRLSTQLLRTQLRERSGGASHYRYDDGLHFGKCDERKTQTQKQVFALVVAQLHFVWYCDSRCGEEPGPLVVEIQLVARQAVSTQCAMLCLFADFKWKHRNENTWKSTTNGCGSVLVKKLYEFEPMGLVCAPYVHDSLCAEKISSNITKRLPFSSTGRFLLNELESPRLLGCTDFWICRYVQFVCDVSGDQSIVRNLFAQFVCDAAETGGCRSER